jgi:hypothetical protein
MDKMCQIVGVLVRIAAIYIVLNVISLFSGQAFWLIDTEELEAHIIVAMIALITVPLLLAFLMWKYPLTIARKIVPEEGEGKKIGELPIDNVQIAALAVVGIFIVVMSASDLLYWFIYIREIEDSRFGDKLAISGYASLYSNVLELILGFLLIFGGKGIIGLINLVRYAWSNK